MFDTLWTLSRLYKQMLTAFVDTLLIFISIFGSLFVGISETLDFTNHKQWLLCVVTGLFSIGVFLRLGLYRSFLRFLNIKILITIAISTFLSTVLLISIIYFMALPIPRTVPIIYFSFVFMLCSCFRLLVRFIYCNLKQKKASKVVIYGCGSSGQQLATALEQSTDHKVVAFLDDDSNLTNNIIQGLKVYTPGKLNVLKNKFSIEKVLIAIPSISKHRQQKLIQGISHINIEILSIPGLSDIVNGHAKIHELRPIHIEDLLGREPIPPKKKLIAATITNKSVLVTGAGGSIGSEICSEIIQHQPKQLILLDHSEYNLYAIDKKLAVLKSKYTSSTSIKTFLGSVRDHYRLEEICKTFKIHTIYHTAAYKHVPLVESNITEGVLNNIFGTLTTAEVALKTKVDTFVLISTDKAVRPTNVMGATKRFAELCIQAIADKSNHTSYCMVRFGNVLGSSGSVIPLFEQQIKNKGPLTVTHPNIIRYFMTIKEAAQLVIQAATMCKGGDVFVLDMGKPTKIVDLARKMIQLSGLTIKDSSNPTGDIEIIYTGLRQGEKLYEELLLGSEISKTKHPRIMTSKEVYLPWKELSPYLKRLKHACLENDSQSLKMILTEAPLAYTPKVKTLYEHTSSNKLKQTIQLPI